MPRYLKSLYPCNDCQEPTQVRGRWEAPRIRCKQCSEKARLNTLAGLLARQANHEARAANKYEPGSPEFIAGWLKASGEALHAARRWIEKPELFTSAENRKRATLAAGWILWVKRNLAADLASDLPGEYGFEVLEGAATPTPTETPAPPKLRLVSKQEDPTKTR